MSEMRVLVRIAAVILLFAALSFGWQQSKRPIRFAGHVESVDAANKVVTVKHGDVPGFMDAMTMGYGIDDEVILKKIAPGDDIVATVYAGDSKLYKVRIVGHAKKEKK